MARTLQQSKGIQYPTNRILLRPFVLASMIEIGCVASVRMSARINVNFAVPVKLPEPAVSLAPSPALVLAEDGAET